MMLETLGVFFRVFLYGREECLYKIRYLTLKSLGYLLIKVMDPKCIKSN